MFRQVRLADFEQQPKRQQVETIKPSPQTVFPNGNLVATEPIRALVLPPRPKILVDLTESDDSANTHSDLDPHTGWAMVAADDGVRLWPVRGTNTNVTPIVFKGENLIPVFVKPEFGSNQPEIVLLNSVNGDILHFRRISFALTEKPASGRIGLASNERITKVIACGSSVVCASSFGNMYLIQLRDGFGSVCAPAVHRMTQSWFSWNMSAITDLSSFGNSHVACLRESGQVQVYSVSTTFTHVLDCDLRSVKLKGEVLSMALDANDTIYVVTRDNGSYKLARIVAGILEQQHSLPKVQSTSARVYLSGPTKYVLFDHQLVVLEWTTTDVETANDVSSLVKTAKALNLEAPHHGSLFFKPAVRVYGCKQFDQGCMLLTSCGVCEVDSEIKDHTSMESLFEQAVYYYYWSDQSPLTFVPAVQQAVQSDGNLLANRVAINLCEKIASSNQVPALPDMKDHLDSRINWVRVLINFSLQAIDLNTEARVCFQNNFEQLLTCRELSDLAGSVAPKNPREWLLYKTHKAVDLLKRVPINRAVDALYTALETATPRLVVPGVRGYWLTQPDVLTLIQQSNHEVTPQSAKLVCTILSYASADRSLSRSVAEQKQNLLLKDLAGRGNVQEATDIASSLSLLSPLASLMTDRWLGQTISSQELFTMIEEHGYEFAQVVFQHLESVGETALVTTELQQKFPKFVLRFFDKEPKIQWALADINGDRKLACEVLVQACIQEQEDKRRTLLASLLRIEAAIVLDFESGNEATKILAQQQARAQAKVAVRTPLRSGVTNILNDNDDTLLTLSLLPPCTANYVAAINLLPWGATDAHKRVLAQQIVLNTDWDQITEASLIYQVLWNQSIDRNGLEALEAFLLGDWQVTNDDVQKLVSTNSKRVKYAADVARFNIAALELNPEIRDWVRGACKKVIGNTVANSAS